MKSIVVYESMFGNTERVARAIAEALGRCGGVELVEVGDAAASLGSVDLLVVGGPTHAFGMSRESTRADAARKVHSGGLDGPEMHVPHVRFEDETEAS